MPQRQNSADRFEDLNSQAWFEAEDQDLDSDNDSDRPVVSVDLSEEDIDKAITAGFGPEQDDDDSQDDDSDSKPRKKKARRRGSEELSRGVRKRVEREQRVTRRERQARIEAEAERDRLRKEVEDLQTWRTDVESRTGKREIEDLDKELDSLEADLTKATEDDDSAQIAKITKRLTEATVKRDRAQEALNRKPPDRGKKPDSEGDDDTSSRTMDRRAQDLIAANADWWEDDAHREDHQIVLAIDRTLASEGYKPNTDEFYVEMVRRARERGLRDLIKLPEWMGEDDFEEEEEEEPKPRRSNGRQRGRRQVGPMGGTGGTGNADVNRLKRVANGKVQLTERDMARMRQFRLDPANPKHVKQFAQSLQQSAIEQLDEMRA